MIPIPDFISQFPQLLSGKLTHAPWEITRTLKEILPTLIPTLGPEFKTTNGVAIHQTAIVEPNVTFKPPVIVLESCFIGANSYFREGVFLDAHVHIGPGCEVKSSIICAHTALAHFNYIGNSIIGAHVNFEAGSIAANHYNERTNKQIRVEYNNTIYNTGETKFGSLVGDRVKIGANAVLSPGTLLLRDSVVKRLELVEQLKARN